MMLIKLCIFFSDFLDKSKYRYYPFELPQITCIEAIQMCTNNIYFHKEVDRSKWAVIWLDKEIT